MEKVDSDKIILKIQRKNSKTPIKEDCKENAHFLKRCLPSSFNKGEVTPKRNACREVLSAINKVFNY